MSTVTNQSNVALFNLAMIIDDDSLSSFINQHVFQINKHIFKDSIILPSGFSALDYLKKALNDGTNPWPDVIFLDISMPAVDGFDFLEIYQKEIPIQFRNKISLYFVSGSKENDTIKSYISKGIVKGYFEKPLNEKKLKERFGF